MNQTNMQERIAYINARKTKVHLPIAKQSIHYYSLQNILTPSEMKCLKSFQLTKVHTLSHLKAPCYLLRRLAQAFNNLLNKNPDPSDDKWFENDWTLLVHCLSNKTLLKKLHPHNRHLRTSIPMEMKQITFNIELNPDYNTGTWNINKHILYKTAKHHFGGNPMILKRISSKAKRLLKNKEMTEQLPKLYKISWLNAKLLNPETLLKTGQKKLKANFCKSFQLQPMQPNSIESLTLRMMNIRTLTKQKLLLHKATEILTNNTPDIYIYTESKFKPKDEDIYKHRTIAHSCPEPGKAGTTLVINNKIDVIEIDDKISDTIFATIQKKKTTAIIVGTYFPQRNISRPQRLKLILEYLNTISIKYKNPNILIFGDFNMKPAIVEKIISSSTTAAQLKLRVINNYQAPEGFPHLATRLGTNIKNQKVYSRIDYIITNQSCKINTHFDQTLSDHIIFNAEIALNQTFVQKTLSINRNKILKEIHLQKPEKLSSTLKYIKNNQHTFNKIKTKNQATQSLFTYL